MIMRQRSKRLLLGVLLCGGLSTGLAYPAFTARVAEPGTAAVAAAATTVMDLLAARSPGGRPEGVQPSKVKSANARSMASPVTRTPDQAPAAQSARLLPSLVVPQAGPGDTQAEFPPEFIIGDAVAPSGLIPEGVEEILPVGSLANAPLAGIVLAPLPPGGGVAVPPGGGAPSEPPAQPPVLNPVSPIPEPGTWLTMLIGFAVVGHSLRRARRLRIVGRPKPAPAHICQRG
jgi:hypothetical protein